MAVAPDKLLAVVVAAIAAGVASTLIQILLWWGFTDASPWSLLSRDARLTAAVVMGRKVLPPSVAFDPAVWLAAALIHFALSIAYAAILAPLILDVETGVGMIVGAAFGAAIYVVNLYGFTAIFPWFVLVRGWITLTAHVAFGVTLAGVGKALGER